MQVAVGEATALTVVNVELVPVGEAAVAGRALAVVVMLAKDMPERSSGGFRAAGHVCAE
jgi:hypothetical protein